MIVQSCLRPLATARQHDPGHGGRGDGSARREQRGSAISTGRRQRCLQCIVVQLQVVAGSGCCIRLLAKARLEPLGTLES